MKFRGKEETAMAKEYFIIVDGEKVPVSEEVYRAFKRPLWAERKRREVRAEHERSLEAFMDGGLDIPDGGKLVDAIVEDKLMLEMLFAALAELTDDERNLIDALFFEEKTEREAANALGLSQKAINKRRHKILEKLRGLMGL
jgi:RNA polymerase sigma factor (sigma-70 family)